MINHLSREFTPQIDLKNGISDIFRGLVDLFKPLINSYKMFLDIALEDFDSKMLDVLFEIHIDSARDHLLGLENDWDDNGAVAINRENFDTMVDSLDTIYNWLIENKLEVDFPNIGPCPDGSIDLHWKTKKYELLINFPADKIDIASIYGDNYGDFFIEAVVPRKELKEYLDHWLLSVS